MLSALRQHAAEHQSLDGTTGELARWLAARRYLRTRGSQTAIDAELDLLDPTWAQPRRG